MVSEIAMVGRFFGEAEDPHPNPPPEYQGREKWRGFDFEGSSGILHRMPEEQPISVATEADLAEIRRFLIEGFGTDGSAICFDADVLRWKFFGPIGESKTARSLISRHEGKIVGHIGLCPREFYVPGKGRISTVHFIDWLASREHPLVGLTLMLQGCEMAQTQYGIGGSAQGRAMLAQLGYEEAGLVGDYVRVLSPGYRLRQSGGGMRKYAAAARDAGRLLLRPGARPTVDVEVRRVEEFSEEIDRLVQSVESEFVFTTRSPELLNYYLGFPGGNINGWTIHEDGKSVGFALVGVFKEDGVRVGRIIECFLQSREQPIWQAAVWAIVRQMKCDLVSCYASLPSLREALENCGFYLQRELPFTLRDPQKLLPRDLPVHLTRLEGDYAYL
jgi:hypothetical protein